MFIPMCVVLEYQWKEVHSQVSTLLSYYFTRQKQIYSYSVELTGDPKFTVSFFESLATGCCLSSFQVLKGDP
jgi:hypothetical protein